MHSWVAAIETQIQVREYWDKLLGYKCRSSLSMLSLIVEYVSPWYIYFMQSTSGETAMSRLTSNGDSYQYEATLKILMFVKILMFEHKWSVEHSKDGRRVERADMRRCYKTNQPLSYKFSVDYKELKFSEMFHSTLGLKINTSFSGVFE